VQCLQMEHFLLTIINVSVESETGWEVRVVHYGLNKKQNFRLKTILTAVPENPQIEGAHKTCPEIETDAFAAKSRALQ